MLDSNLNDFDVHPRSQGYKIARTCAVILLQSCMKQLKIFINVRDTYLCNGSDCEKVLYGEYKLFEHLLFLFLLFFWSLLKEHYVADYLKNNNKKQLKQNKTNRNSLKHKERKKQTDKSKQTNR